MSRCNFWFLVLLSLKNRLAVTRDALGWREELANNLERQLFTLERTLLNSQLRLSRLIGQWRRRPFIVWYLSRVSFHSFCPIFQFIYQNLHLFRHSYDPWHFNILYFLKNVVFSAMFFSFKMNGAFLNILKHFKCWLIFTALFTLCSGSVFQLPSVLSDFF